MVASPVPEGFNPDECPILSVHWFGLGARLQANDRQPVPVGPIVDNIVGDLSFQRDVERLHRLGPRPQYELLREIERRYGCARFIRDRVKAYGELDPGLVQALGGDGFPEAPVHEVRR